LNADGTKYVLERVTRYEEGKSYDIDIYGGNQKPPVKDLLATIGIREISPYQTVVYLQMTYNAGRNPIMWVIAHTMIKNMMNRLINAVVDGAKYHLETGNAVKSIKVLQAAKLTPQTA
jgi:hypothetical protein